MNELRQRVSDVIEKAIPWAVMGLIMWLLGLYSWQRETNRRLEEIERQAARQWESIDNNNSESEIAILKEWKRLMEYEIMREHP